MNLSEVLKALQSRLPELAWQLGKPGIHFTRQSLPPGLFRYYGEEPDGFIQEIKSDIHSLTHHSNTKVAQYLAEKINQKINVLVAICSETRRQAVREEPQVFIMDKLSTRQQWLSSMEAVVQRLDEQKKSLEKALADKNNARDCLVSLQLRKELGALEKELTLAKEAYARAIG